MKIFSFTFYLLFFILVNEQKSLSYGQQCFPNGCGQVHCQCILSTKRKNPNNPPRFSNLEMGCFSELHCSNKTQGNELTEKIKCELKASGSSSNFAFAGKNFKGTTIEYNDGDGAILVFDFPKVKSESIVLYDAAGKKNRIMALGRDCDGYIYLLGDDGHLECKGENILSDGTCNLACANCPYCEKNNAIVEIPLYTQVAWTKMEIFLKGEELKGPVYLNDIDTTNCENVGNTVYCTGRKSSTNIEARCTIESFFQPSINIKDKTTSMATTFLFTSFNALITIFYYLFFE